MNTKRVKQLHLELAEERGLDKTYCPSQVAREYAQKEWRGKMDVVRRVADKLVESGDLFSLQGGSIFSDKPSEARGPIRLRKSDSQVVLI